MTGALRWSRVPHDYPAAPSEGPSRVPGAMYNIGRLPSGVRLMYQNCPCGPLTAASNTGMRDVGGRKQCTARRREDRRPGPNRAPLRCTCSSTEPGSLPHGTRPAPLRCVRFVDGRLAITLHLFSPDTARVPYNM